jgi:hypothetical protein
VSGAPDFKPALLFLGLSLGLIIPYGDNCCVEAFKAWLNRSSGLDKFDEEEEKREVQVPPWLTGVFRALYDVHPCRSGLGSHLARDGLLAWIAAKWLQIGNAAKVKATKWNTRKSVPASSLP